MTTANTSAPPDQVVAARASRGGGIATSAGRARRPSTRTHRPGCWAKAPHAVAGARRRAGHLGEAQRARVGAHREQRHQQPQRVGQPETDQVPNSRIGSTNGLSVGAAGSPVARRRVVPLGNCPWSTSWRGDPEHEPHGGVALLAPARDPRHSGDMERPPRGRSPAAPSAGSANAPARSFGDQF